MADQDEEQREAQAAMIARHQIEEYGLEDVRWGMWVCADCDPGNADPDEDEVVYEKPYVVVDRLPADPGHDPSCPQDYCPRCGDYLPFVFAGEVGVVPLIRRRSPSAA